MNHNHALSTQYEAPEASDQETLAEVIPVDFQNRNRIDTSETEATTTELPSVAERQAELGNRLETIGAFPSLQVETLAVDSYASAPAETQNTPGEEDALEDAAYEQNARIDAQQEAPKTEVGELHDKIASLEAQVRLLTERLGAGAVEAAGRDGAISSPAIDALRTHADAGRDVAADNTPDRGNDYDAGTSSSIDRSAETATSGIDYAHMSLFSILKNEAKIRTFGRWNSWREKRRNEKRLKKEAKAAAKAEKAQAKQDRADEKIARKMNKQQDKADRRAEFAKAYQERANQKAEKVQDGVRRGVRSLLPNVVNWAKNNMEQDRIARNAYKNNLTPSNESEQLSLVEKDGVTLTPEAVSDAPKPMSAEQAPEITTSASETDTGQLGLFELPTAPTESAATDGAPEKSSLAGEDSQTSEKTAA